MIKLEILGCNKNLKSNKIKLPFLPSQMFPSSFSDLSDFSDRPPWLLVSGSDIGFLIVYLSVYMIFLFFLTSYLGGEMQKFGSKLCGHDGLVTSEQWKSRSGTFCCFPINPSLREFNPEAILLGFLIKYMFSNPTDLPRTGHPKTQN